MLHCVRQIEVPKRTTLSPPGKKRDEKERGGWRQRRKVKMILNKEPCGQKSHRAERMLANNVGEEISAGGETSTSIQTEECLLNKLSDGAIGGSGPRSLTPNESESG